MMHNGYCTFPIGSSYTWVNISKTGSQIFTKFSGFLGGSLVDLESVKISGSDSGILKEGWEKSLTPSIYPLGGDGTPIFSLGGLPSLYCQISRPCDKNWGLGGGAIF